MKAEDCLNLINQKLKGLREDARKRQVEITCMFGIFKIFKKKCSYCSGEEINTEHFTNPINGDDICIQYFNKNIRIGFNDSLIGEVAIKYCPMCSRNLEQN